MTKQNLKLKIFILSAACFAFFALAGEARAADYYAHPTGSGTACFLASPCSLSTLNTKLQAGDTGYLRGGTYAQQIAPSSNGTSGSPIIYTRYEAEAVSIANTSTRQADLENKQYITIDGLSFLNAPGAWIYARTSQGVAVKNCNFTNALGYQGISLWGASFAKIQNNTFSSGECGYPGNTVDYCPGDFISLYGADGTANRNIIEGNTFNKVMHEAINGGGTYNIIRGNIVENRWHSGGSIHFMTTCAPNLVEGNIYRNCGMEYFSNPSSSARGWARRDQRSTQYLENSCNVILRKNIFFNNGTFSMAGFDSQFSRDHRIYNNTFDQDYRSIYVIPSSPQGHVGGIVLKNNSINNAVEDYNIYWTINNENTNFFANNNLYGANSRYRGTTGSAGAIQAAYPSEWSGNTARDPLFINRSARDYTLQSASPLIDAGAWLTTVTSHAAGQRTLTVADASYFCDGWGIIEGDDVQFQGDSNTYRISSINYDTNVITLFSAPASSKTGLGIALPFNGSAPDIGAKEYQGEGDVQVPVAPGGLNVR